MSYRKQSLPRPRSAHLAIWRLPPHILLHSQIFDAQDVHERLVFEEELERVGDLMCRGKVDEPRVLVEVAHGEDFGQRLPDGRGGGDDFVDVPGLGVDERHFIIY